jgi:5-bromo-4-chloroindolyl phosphate hydrolysis protein
MDGGDRNWLIAGVVSALLLIGLTVLTSFPFLVSLVIAALVFGGLVFLLAPRKLFEGVDVATIGSGRVEFARDLLTQAAPFAERLRGAATRISDKEVGPKVKHLAEIAADVFSKVEANPAGAANVRRFLTYYLPRAAEVSEGFAVLEGNRAPDPARLGAVRDVLVKLDDAFVHYADSLTDSELRTLDTDLRLIQASLKEDLGR